MLETVDVLIVGAGASGAAAAWSLSDTRMRIVCLDQGDWPNPAACPSTGRDWETRQHTDHSFNPNIRRAAADYPINEEASPIKIANFNGVGGGTVLYAGHFPRFHPSDFKVKSLDGVGTPRVMLNSRSRHFPDGLANSNGLVGRNLMFHPYAAITGYFDEPLDGGRGPSNGLWSQEFYETDLSRGFVRGFTYEFSRGGGPASQALSTMGTGRVPIGSGHHKAFRQRLDRSTGMVAICEDLPELHNTVTLDETLKDSHGIPAPKITYALSENSRRMLDFAMARGAEVMKAAGAYDVRTDSPLAFGGWHLMGTARMGRDPKTSVVNEWGRSHDVKNLFIIDGSLFVTSAGLNPTSTIQALALYVADAIKSRLANLFD